MEKIKQLKLFYFSHFFGPKIKQLETILKQTQKNHF
jgi:hypothetical protein